MTYTNDAAGRLNALSSVATSYAPAASVSSIGYAAHNALNTETYGNGLIHGVSYNNRLQATEIKLGTSGNPTSLVSLGYGYGTTSNNRNVLTHAYSGGGLSYTQTFGYDSLNRLTTSSESGSSWSQTNGYDRYGNRWIDLGGGNQSLYFTASTNRITGWSYDAAGNLLSDGSHSYSYDAENKITDVDATAAYVYDGEGQRVRKLVGENLRFVYGIGGQLIAEFSGSSGSLVKEYIYGASGLLATIDANGTRYTTPDHLGSPRVVTNSSASVVSRHDYMPFGEELGAGIGGRTTAMGFPGTSDGIRQKFTAKERDNETGLDFFQARFYSLTQARFTSPDPLLASGRTFAPQSWNRYTYVLNNPLSLIDPTGLADENPDDQKKNNQEQRPTPSPIQPCQAPASVVMTPGPPQVGAGVPLAGSNKNFTGALSVFSIEVKDVNNNTITDGITVTEHVDRENTEGGLDIVQNQRAMSPLKNGVFPDIVGIGEDSTKPFDRTNAKDVEHASNVIQTALQTPITDTTRQTLTVSGCNTTLTVVNERTQSNIDSATGKVRPFTSNGRLVNNYNYSIKVVSGPLRVGNR